MWRKTKALPADPHCSYRCSTVGPLSLLRHSHTGNSEKKTPRIFGDFARRQIPKWQTKQFSDLWNWKNSTFPVWVFRVTLKEMLFESALHARHPLPSSSTFTATSSLRKKRSRYITNIFEAWTHSFALLNCKSSGCRWLKDVKKMTCLLNE